jgi:hypothetical protein
VRKIKCISLPPVQPPHRTMPLWLVEFDDGLWVREFAPEVQ